MQLVTRGKLSSSQVRNSKLQHSASTHGLAVCVELCGTLLVCCRTIKRPQLLSLVAFMQTLQQAAMLMLHGYVVRRDKSETLQAPAACNCKLHNLCVSACFSVAGASGQLEFRELNMNQTLHENGVHDESHTYETLDLPSDFHIPVLHVYWNDDLTVA